MVIRDIRVYKQRLQHTILREHIIGRGISIPSLQIGINKWYPVVY